MIPPGKTHSVRLCATFVRTVNVPGRYGDGYGGHGLSLLVTPRKSGGFSKTWAQAISPNGAKTSLGLGSWPVVTLALARDRALANTRAIAEGRDPRRRMRQVQTLSQANETVVEPFVQRILDMPSLLEIGRHQVRGDQRHAPPCSPCHGQEAGDRLGLALVLVFRPPAVEMLLTARRAPDTARRASLRNVTTLSPPMPDPEAVR